MAPAMIVARDANKTRCIFSFCSFDATSVVVSDNLFYLGMMNL